MKKRLFLAILLPDDIKEELLEIEKKYERIFSEQKKFKKLNIRWTPQENLHFTLVFIGWMDEGRIEKIKEIVNKIAERSSPLILKLEKLILGPDDKKPRMIWATGPCIRELNALREKIISEFKNNNIGFEDNNSFKLHITLARSKNKGLYGRKIEDELDLSFGVGEIFLMESELKPEGPKYKNLEKFEFKK